MKLTRYKKTKTALFPHFSRTGTVTGEAKKPHMHQTGKINNNNQLAKTVHLCAVTTRTDNPLSLLGCRAVLQVCAACAGSAEPTLHF